LSAIIHVEANGPGACYIDARFELSGIRFVFETI